MINSLIWRIKEAFAVLTGNKKTQANLKKPAFPERSINNLPSYQTDNDEQLHKYISSKKIEFIFIEIGENRVNAGGNVDLQNQNRLNPSYATVKHYFPSAKCTVYSDFDLQVEGVELKKIPQEKFDLFEEHPRKLYRLVQYMKLYAITHSDADIAIAIDTDMFVFSENIYRLIYLTDKFGFCLPSSNALCMNFDVEHSLDTYPITDESGGLGSTFNITPMTFKTSDERGRAFYNKCMETTVKKGSRSSISMWNAIWESGLYPYMLPREFCVCRGSEGIGNEVILHVGHKSVAEYYNIKI